MTGDWTELLQLLKESEIDLLSDVSCIKLREAPAKELGDSGQ